MSSRHRLLQRSITHVSLHNRLTEEDVMWRRREQEREAEQNISKRQHRSCSPYKKRKQFSRKRHSSSSLDNESKRKKNNNQTEVEFGPPLPSNLGIDAERWDHAFFMQRYPEEYEKQINRSKRKESTSSKDKKKKKKYSRHHRHRRRKAESKKKKYRSKS